MTEQMTCSSCGKPIGQCRLGEIEVGRPGRVSRAAFAKLAGNRGWTDDEFCAWADAHEWDLP